MQDLGRGIAFTATLAFVAFALIMGWHVAWPLAVLIIGAGVSAS